MTPLKYKRTMNRTKIRRNLKGWLDRATNEDIINGKLWYRDANAWCDEIARGYGIDAKKVAMVLSALSPSNRWGRNKEDAQTMVRVWYTAVKDGVDPRPLLAGVKVCTFNSNKEKAIAILMDGLDITSRSPKTHAFVQNIAHLDSGYVTIDRWHMRACNTLSRSPKEVKTTLTPKQYGIITDITTSIAKREGVTPFELQAIVWCAIKNEWGR